MIRDPRVGKNGCKKPQSHATWSFYYCPAQTQGRSRRKKSLQLGSKSENCCTANFSKANVLIKFGLAMLSTLIVEVQRKTYLLLLYSAHAGGLDLTGFFSHVQSFCLERSL